MNFRMKHKIALSLIAAVVASALLSAPARAQLVFSVMPSTAAAGGAGSFDVDLTDLGGTYDIGGFSFELTVPSASGIMFTAAGMNTTAPYIFASASLDADNSSPLSYTSFPTTDVIASDAYDIANSGVTVSTGDSFGLGSISYSVASNTPLSTVPVSFSENGTSLSDPSGSAIDYTTMDGTIVVTPTVIAPTPEPSPAAALVMLFIGLGSLLLRTQRRKTAR